MFSVSNLPDKFSAWIVLFSLCLLSAACAQAPRATPVPSAEVRALWVTRWDYRKPEDIQTIARNAVSAGFNRLYFQVRGEATTFYPSEIEPWAWELSGNVSDTGKDPGWDPLATAIKVAHYYGLELHAYMNVLPAWKVKEAPPARSGHVMVDHPEWIMRDKKGQAMSPRRTGFYAFLNPAMPEVRKYIASVFQEVAMNYPTLDGIHYDYIRYPGEMGDYSHDNDTLAEFKSLTGGKSPAQAPKLWNHYRCSQVDTLVRDITLAVRKANPDLEISAAVIANLQIAQKQKCQQWIEWTERGLVDTLVPMAYHYDMEKYEEYLDSWLGALKPVAGNVIVGIWPAEKWQEKYDYSLKTLQKQIEMARKKGADGVSVFAYSTIFPEGKFGKWAGYLKTEVFR